MRGVSLCTSTGGGNYRDEQREKGGGGLMCSWAAAWKRGCVARLKGQTLTKIRERLHQGEIEMTARGSTVIILILWWLSLAMAGRE